MIRLRTNKLAILYTGEHDILVTNLSDNTQIRCKRNSVVIVGRNVRISFMADQLHDRILRNTVFFDHTQIITLKKIMSLAYGFSKINPLDFGTDSPKIRKIISIEVNDRIKNSFYNIISEDSHHNRILSFIFFCKESSVMDAILPLIYFSAATTFCNRVIELIESNIAKKWTLRLLSEEFSISEITIRKKLEAEGVIFRELILEIRMKKAMTLLIAGELSVSKIADKVGYNNISYFISHFRQFFGMTPKQLHLLLTK